MDPVPIQRSSIELEIGGVSAFFSALHVGKALPQQLTLTAPHPLFDFPSDLLLRYADRRGRLP